MTQKNKNTKFLLGHRVNMCAKDNWGRMMLMHASCSGGKKKTVKIFLRHDIDIYAKDDGGYAPLMKGVQWSTSELMKLLRKYGAKE